MPKIDENAFGQEASFLESDVERYEQDEEAAQTRTEKLEDAIGRIAQDAHLVESLKKNQVEAKGELEEARQLHDRLASETSALLSQLHDQMDVLVSERETLYQLEAVGEDVTAAMGVLDDRQAWLEQCEEQMIRIGDRLDVALDVYDMNDGYTSSAANSDSSARRIEERPSSALEREGISGDSRNEGINTPVSDFNLVGVSAGLDGINGGHSDAIGAGSSYSAKQKSEARRASDPSEISSIVPGLVATQEPTKQLPNGGTIYDSPDTQIDKLNWLQGLYSDKYQGTCGLCSVQNIARMAGKNLSERDVVELARKNGLCADGWNLHPGRRGGTSPETRQKLLSLVGIDSHIDMDTGIEHIADLVESGRGVIVSVNPTYFWHGKMPFDLRRHAVVVTSVERDAKGFPTVFHVCDSGFGYSDYRIGFGQFSGSIAPGRGLNVTDRIIR